MIPRIINTQPTFLTNYRELYEGLQQAFGIRDLVVKVKKSSAELDYLLNEQYRRRKARQHEKMDNAKMVLTMVAEAYAPPYYLYNLLAHAFHLPGILAVIKMMSITILVLKGTFLVMQGATKNLVFEKLGRDLKVIPRQVWSILTWSASASRKKAWSDP